MHTQIITFPNEGVGTLPKVEFGGYIYAIEFDTGLVKVGKTQDPSARIKTHEGHGRAFGAGITRFWVSAAHDNYNVNEKLFIFEMRLLGGKTNRAEYFTGVTLEKAVESAERLDYQGIDNEAHVEDVARRLDGMKKFVLGDRDLDAERREAKAISEDRYSVIDRLFGAVIGSANNAHMFPTVTRGTVPLSMLRPMADFQGVSVADVAKWNMIDMIEETAKVRVRVAALELTIWAREHGRDDLLAPMIVEVSA